VENSFHKLEVIKELSVRVYTSLYNELANSVRTNENGVADYPHELSGMSIKSPISEIVKYLLSYSCSL